MFISVKPIVIDGARFESRGYIYCVTIFYRLGKMVRTYSIQSVGFFPSNSSAVRLRRTADKVRKKAISRFKIHRIRLVRRAVVTFSQSSHVNSDVDSIRPVSDYSSYDISHCFWFQPCKLFSNRSLLRAPLTTAWFWR